MTEILTIDEFAEIDPAKFDALTTSNNRILIVDHKTGVNNMGSLNRSLLRAALLLGLVTATNGAQHIPAAVAANALAPPEPHQRRSRGGYTSRLTGAAAHKRAARKLRNVRARMSKR